MRADSDFTGYVVARWASVVRVVVVLGQPLEQAEETAVASFARLLPDWGRLRREDDVDVELAKVVLDGWARARSESPAPRVPVPVPAVPVMTQDLEDRLALLERLVDGLDRLDEATRVTVVLHHLGELDHDQVADVLGEPRVEVGRRLREAAEALDLVPLDPACHTAATAIDVPPPAVSRVVDRASGARRRRWLVFAAVAGALALVAGVAYGLSRSSGTDREGLLGLSPVENVVDVSWWLDGTLHLAHGTVEVPDLTQLVEIPDGVVYVDSTGALRSVTDDGLELDLGDIAPGSTVVSQARAGWVAWTLPDGGDTVVYDATRDREIGRVDASVDAELIGFDRERFYYHSEGADWVVTVNGALSLSSPEEVPPPEGSFGTALLDVASGTQLRSSTGALKVVPSLSSVEQLVPGSTGQLSGEGNFVLARVDSARGERVALYDARDGAVDGDWFAANAWMPLAATFTAEGRVAWVVDTLDGGYGLYECQASRDYVSSDLYESQPCGEPLELDGVPVLAGARPGLNVLPSR